MNITITMKFNISIMQCAVRIIMYLDFRDYNFNISQNTHKITLSMKYIHNIYCYGITSAQRTSNAQRMWPLGNRPRTSHT